jgi:hypothetical protein
MLSKEKKIKPLKPRLLSVTGKTKSKQTNKQKTATTDADIYRNFKQNKQHMNTEINRRKKKHANEIN